MINVMPLELSVIIKIYVHINICFIEMRIKTIKLFQWVHCWISYRRIIYKTTSLPSPTVDFPDVKGSDVSVPITQP